MSIREWLNGLEMDLTFRVGTFTAGLIGVLLFISAFTLLVGVILVRVGEGLFLLVDSFFGDSFTRMGERMFPVWVERAAPLYMLS